MHCNAATWNFITSRKSHPRTGIGGPSKQQRVVLRRRNTVVGGKCALPSALLVLCVFILHAGQPEHPTSRTDVYFVGLSVRLAFCLLTYLLRLRFD